MGVRLAVRWLTITTVISPLQGPQGPPQGPRRWQSPGRWRCRPESAPPVFCTRARAMVSRWRWPPEKFRPPCSTGSSRPRGFSRTKSAAWAVSRAAQRAASSASPLPPEEVGTDGAGEELGPLGHHRHQGPELLLGIVGHCPAEEADPAAGGVVKPGDQVHHAGLAAAGAADDAEGLPPPDGKGNVLQALPAGAG